MCNHHWKPIPRRMATYVCPKCGLTGYRAAAGIQEHRRVPETTHSEEQVIGSTAGRKPSLDDYDRRSR